MNLPAFKLPHVSKKLYAYLTVLVLCVSSYLCLANLDHEPLAFGEDTTVLIANNLLKTGTLNTWDGRNLVSNINGLNMNADGVDVMSPLKYVLSAVGVYLFGFSEAGGRIIQACFGVLALIVFLLILNQHLPNNPRLQFLIFLFVCLSPQLLLFFRGGRYYSFAIFSLLTCFYFYEAYWRGCRPIHLISMSIFALLGFLNHYTHGAAAMLVIAVYHVVFRSSNTSKKQCLLFALAALAVVLIGTMYWHNVGLLAPDHPTHHYFSTHNPDIHPSHSSTWYFGLLKLWVGMKSIVACDWVSWFICVWFFIHWVFCLKGRESDNSSRRLILLGVLFFIISVLISGQRRHLHHIDLRYSLAALPFLMVMKGMFIDWLMGKRKVFASAVLIALIASNIGAAPFNYRNQRTGKSTLDFYLVSLIKQIHHYRAPTVFQNVADYLRVYANKDDLVYVDDLVDFAGMHHRELLHFYAGDHVLFCCQIDEGNARLKDTVKNFRSSLIADKDTIPDWILFFKPYLNMRWKDYFELHNVDKFHGYTHVSLPAPLAAGLVPFPQLYYRVFEARLLPMDAYVYVLKRNKIASH